jgi:hypothetical protein
MFGAIPFGVPYFAGHPATALTPTPATAHRVPDTFDHWLNGVPVIVPEFDGSFSQWSNGAPDVEQGAQAFVRFSSAGIASASALLGALIANFSSGTGIAVASVQISATAAAQVSGTGIASANALLKGVARATVSGTGIAFSSAILSAGAPSMLGKGTGVAAASAQLSFYRTLAAKGAGIARASATLSAYVSVIVGPPLPGFPSIQQSIPQFVSMFGYEMQPILDVLKTRKVPLNYVSPPVCAPCAQQSGSSYRMTPAWL